MFKRIIFVEEVQPPPVLKAAFDCYFELEFAGDLR